MQPLAIARQTTGSLLFVRTSGHLGRAIREVNEVLSYRRRRLTPGEEVLAVIECDDVESSPLLSGHTDPVSPRGDLVVRESFGLSGVWNLCCFDITILRHPVTPEQRRGRLLDALCLGHDVASRDAPAAARLARLRVLPVFAPTEVLDDVERAVDDLAARYPRLRVGPTAFLHDPDRRERELVPWMTRCASSERAEEARGMGTSSTATSMTPHVGTEATDETF